MLLPASRYNATLIYPNCLSFLLSLPVIICGFLCTFWLENDLGALSYFIFSGDRPYGAVDCVLRFAVDCLRYAASPWWPLMLCLCCFTMAALQGLGALAELNTFVLRISLASFAAYVVGQAVDIQVFDRLRQMKEWWVALTASDRIGQPV